MPSMRQTALFRWRCLPTIMRRALKNLLKRFRDEKNHYEDLHIIRFYSLYVVIANGKVIDVTRPHMVYCPLANSLYRNLNLLAQPGALKEAIINSVNSKISKFGYFTAERELSRSDVAIPYGASEILMYALRKKVVDAAVVVCDGAGTVIVKKPEVVQGVT